VGASSSPSSIHTASCSPTIIQDAIRHLLYLEERALYEEQLIKLTRHQIRRVGLILRRTADDNNTYYLGRFNDFNFQARTETQTLLLSTYS
jgi:hypothetical protein